MAIRCGDVARGWPEGDEAMDRHRLGAGGGRLGLVVLAWLATTAAAAGFLDGFERGGSTATAITGRVIGGDTQRRLELTLTTRDDWSELRAVRPDAAGYFRFEGLRPDTEYTVAIAQSGYRFEGSVLRTRALSKRALTRLKSEDPGTAAAPVQGGSVQELRPGDHVEFVATPLATADPHRFVYAWRENVNVAGAEYASYVNAPLAVEVLDAGSAPAEHQAAIALLERYGIVLQDAELPWSAEHAYRLLEMLDRLEGQESVPYQDLSSRLQQRQSRWRLSEHALPDDIQILRGADGVQQVRIAQQAFVYAAPVLARVEGKRGRFYSNRLFQAVIRYLTDEGRDLQRMAQLLRQSYGLEIAIDDSFAGRYLTLPVHEEDRTPASWRRFRPDELIRLAGALEEFPPGMRDISFPDRAGGLRYLLRRLDGNASPHYPSAPAIAWTRAGYIEFMESAFSNPWWSYTQRLILHEKAHFLWEWLFTPALKYDWLKLSGWYRAVGGSDGDCASWRSDRERWSPPNVQPHDLSLRTPPHRHDPAGGDGPIVPAGEWASCSTTQFVSVYAAVFDPNEDMAESIAFFMTNPDLLRSRALPKYEFIRDRIMQGSIYLSLIRPDLTFQVLNLYPDYVYPGKINRVDISVGGAPEQDKTVTLSIGLHTSSCSSDAHPACLDRASHGFLRLFSPAGTYVDVHLAAETARGDSLGARFVLPAQAAAGWWAPRAIVITDAVGNTRIEKASSGDFGWKLYVNNHFPDTTAPAYVANSLTATVLRQGDAAAPLDLLADERELLLRWRAIEHETPFGECYVTIASRPDGGSFNPYSVGVYGPSGADYLGLGYRPFAPGQADGATGSCEARWRITRYVPSGEYFPAYLTMSDRARNYSGLNFSPDHPSREAPPSVRIDSATGDTVAPVLDSGVCRGTDPAERCLRLQAQPLNPGAPDGETLVRLSYWAYEDQPLAFASGLNMATVLLRNPQGQEFHYYHTEVENGPRERSPDRRRYFSCPTAVLNTDPGCNATTPVQYVFQVVLPRGSAPGTWGVAEMTLIDKVGNRRQYSFTEVLRFDVER